MLQALGLGDVVLRLYPHVQLEARGAMVGPSSCSAQCSSTMSPHGVALT